MAIFHSEKPREILVYACAACIQSVDDQGIKLSVYECYVIMISLKNIFEKRYYSQLVHHIYVGLFGK